MRWVFISIIFLAGCNSFSAGQILVVGDSISLGYTPYLQNKIAVDHNEGCDSYRDSTTTELGNAGNSKREAACIQMWISQETYSVVYFNAGMHDVHVKGCDQGLTEHQVELSDYLDNLQSIIDAIRSAGATPVFITTTPVEGNVFCHSNSDIIEYNANAIALMHSQGIEVLDLYSFVFPHQNVLHGDNGIHFTQFGYRMMADFLSSSMRGL